MLEALMVAVLEVKGWVTGVFVVWLADFFDEGHLTQVLPRKNDLPLNTLVNVNSIFNPLHLVLS